MDQLVVQYVQYAVQVRMHTRVTIRAQTVRMVIQELCQELPKKTIVCAMLATTSLQTQVIVLFVLRIHTVLAASTVWYLDNTSNPSNVCREHTQNLRGPQALPIVGALQDIMESTQCNKRAPYVHPTAIALVSCPIVL